MNNDENGIKNTNGTQGIPVMVNDGNTSVKFANASPQGINSMPTSESIMVSSVNEVKSEPIVGNSFGVPSETVPPTINTQVEQTVVTPNVSSVQISSPVANPLVSQVQASVSPTTAPVIPTNENHSMLFTQTGVANNPSLTSDTNEVLVTDNIKKVEVEYKPISKLKVFGLIFLFVLLIGFVLFLPDINGFIEKYLKGGNKIVVEKITTGQLVCSYETSTSSMDKEYSLTFGFSNNKLEKLTYSVSSRIDPSSDNNSMNQLISDCMLLKQSVEGLQGISINCKDSTNIFTETDIFTFEKINSEKLSSAFYEAGGNYPEYEYNQNIDQIERDMNATGYRCSRKSN